jgi:hypothetical protein
MLSLALFASLLLRPRTPSSASPPWPPKSPAERLARLLAPDSLGNPQALARRMGVEMIFDCGYWGAGMTQFEQHDPCYKHGKRRKRVDPTVGHINHLHIGLTKAAAARRTSFWSVAR